MKHSIHEKAEDRPRALEVLGGIAMAHSQEVKAGLAAFNAKKKN